MDNHFNLLFFLATSKGEALGTVRWQAPETIGSKPQWTTKADVYSLGMTLWEIAAQQVPFNDIADNTQVSHLPYGVRFSNSISDIVHGEI